MSDVYFTMGGTCCVLTMEEAQRLQLRLQEAMIDARYGPEPKAVPTKPELRTLPTTSADKPWHEPITKYAYATGAHIKYDGGHAPDPRNPSPPSEPACDRCGFSPCLGPKCRLSTPRTIADKPPAPRDALVKHDEPCCPRNPSPTPEGR